MAYNSACINSEMWLLETTNEDPGGELLLAKGVGKKNSGSETDIVLAGNTHSCSNSGIGLVGIWDILVLVTPEMVALSVRSARGGGKAIRSRMWICSGGCCATRRLSSSAVIDGQ